MIGDKITINKGYQLDDDTIINTGENGVDNLFTGFIVKVKSHQPITLYCEDNMYRLKQIKAEDKDWKGASIQEMFTEMLQGSGLAVSEKSSVTINYKVGTFITRGETVAQVLERLRKDFRFHSYFRGDELRIGYPIYYTEEARTLVFKFQENIIDSDLQYKRKDDITLSAIASCKIIKETGKTTKDGQKKTKEEALEILVTLKNGKFKYLSKGKNGFPENVEGERRKLFFTGVTTEQELYDLAQPELQKYYYTGLKGSFLTFGTPHVRHGDNVSISDGVLPDRDGTYKVKKVVYEGGVRGLRQEVFLDYKI